VKLAIGFSYSAGKHTRGDLTSAAVFATFIERSRCMTHLEINGNRLELVQGDIVAQDVDTVVNAANSQLSGGTGVNGAIQRHGGPAVLYETSQRYPQGCATGSAVITAAGDLRASYIIHAVGPVWRGGRTQEDRFLAAAYRRSLELANAYHRRRVAMPALSTGVYGYPLDLAATVAVSTVMDYLLKHRAPGLVRFVLFDEQAFDEFATALDYLRQHPQPPPPEPNAPGAAEPPPLEEPHPLEGLWDEDGGNSDDDDDDRGGYERRLW